MSEQQGFYREYDLTKAQRQPKVPASHQHEALNKLHKWYKTNHSDAGGILVLPTGGGKTLTADRFLCTHPLSDGHKVLWLAHTHHLLDQAFYSLASEVKLIRNKQKLNVRVVSGTKGHFSPAHIDKNDDVVICTLQTVTRAYQNNHPQLEDFLKAAGNKLFVVFDEAHHSPAPSYCRFITALRDRFPQMYLLGLTATPTYTDTKKAGWLTKLFPQKILYQVNPTRLMADKILAQPIFEKSQTHFTPEFSDHKYQDWVKDYRDIPEEIITKLAQSEKRNAFIAKTYADNKERYGKTIIFADRWFQCEQLRGFLEQQNKGIRVGTIYSHIDADPGSADARNKRGKDENATALEAFRNNQLDVLINIRMLTEGTDVPDVNTVFLTRQTTSKILLTQMVGRALRGTAFKGTEKAYIVSFIDNWQQVIDWSEYELEGTLIADEPAPKPSERLPMQLISIDLVRRLIRQMDSGVNISPVPFLTFMPIGWYRVEFETLTEGNETTGIVQRLIIVFENEKANYEEFIKFLESVEEFELKAFIEPNVSFDNQHQQLIENLQDGFFSSIKEQISGELQTNLFHITRHMAQNYRECPDWFDFEQRDEHDLDGVAQRLIDASLNRLQEDEELNEEYSREDRYWKIIYYSYEFFKSQYNACVERLLANKRHGIDQDAPCSTITTKLVPDSEPTNEIKKQVKTRDGFSCLCCGENTRRLLQVDHLNPKYYGGNHLVDNLQTLCVTCNQIKGTRKIDFRKHQTPQTYAPSFLPLELSRLKEAGDKEQWEKLLRRSINFFYDCAAVESIKIGKEWEYWYHWEICLHPSNNPGWLLPYLKKSVREIRQMRSGKGLIGPKEIIIIAPGFDVVEPITG